MGIEEKEIIEEKETDKSCANKCEAPVMKINCNLEASIGNENKIIYVYPNKLQYFTASAICSSNCDTLEIIYTGCNKKCICDEVFICGRLGYYKVVSSGIIFMPRHNLKKLLNCGYPSDILHFKAINKCGDKIEFVVVFTLGSICYK
ncbi:hypothetical protein [Clostridium beijerinckii]|uniref:hypothetical protein n=1 Tax=Clostridium beijerinckii TaxID=1520 RepID=UPI0002F89A81|nr:hypothetical protein [Clostridium beijerinckii]